MSAPKRHPEGPLRGLLDGLGLSKRMSIVEELRDRESVLSGELKEAIEHIHDLEKWKIRHLAEEIQFLKFLTKKYNEMSDLLLRGRPQNG